jgi:hypothetical protein
MLNVIMLNVANKPFVLSVIMLNVAAPSSLLKGPQLPSKKSLDPVF